jgi:hypothetical protein
MRISALIACSAALAVPAAAIASDSPAGDKPQLVCRGAQKALGSRIRKPRKCMTAEQWREADEKAARLPVTMSVVAPKNEGKQRAQ